MRFALIVPAYNEAKVIANTLKRLEGFILSKPDFEWNVVLVDDGSTDGTALRANCNCFDKKMGLSVIKLEENSGKGEAIKKGLESVKADYYGFVDADLSINFMEKFNEIVERLKDSDIVICERDEKKNNYGFIRRVLSGGFNFITKSFFSLKHKDIQCGCKFMNKKGRDLALKVNQSRFSFDLEFLARAKKDKLSVSSQTVTWKHRGDSRVGYQDTMRFFFDILQIAEDTFTKKRLNFLMILLPTLVTGAVFGWVFRSGFFFSDDFTWLWHGKKILGGEINVLTAHMSTFYSPVLNFFYAAMLKVVGLKVWVYFLFGLVVHVINSFLVGKLTEQVQGSSLAGILAAIVFAFAGGAYEPLVWVGANMHSFVAFFMLISSLMLIYGYKSLEIEKNLRGITLFVVSLFAFVLALGTKEVAVALGPILGLVGLWWHLKKKVKLFSPKVIWYWLSISAVFILYLLKQYESQKNSVWVSSGSFEFSFSSLLRLPMVLVDIMLPLITLVKENSAIPIFIFSIGLLIYILKRFKESKAVWFGLVWAMMSAMPVVFFNVINWYDLFPSRYTYSLRVGISMMVGALFVMLLKEGKNVRLAKNFIWVLMFATIAQILIMTNTIERDYGYVYQTGRSLNEISLELKSYSEEKIAFDWFRPFTNNHAHIVGALDVISGLDESQILFLEKDQEPPEDYILVKWNDKEQKYFIEKS